MYQSKGHLYKPLGVNTSRELYDIGIKYAHYVATERIKMSEIKTKIQADVKEAMKNKETFKRDTLRMIMSAFKQIEVDERRELSDEDVIKILQKNIKQREDAMEQYKAGNREDLAEKEGNEIEVIKAYLPAQLSDEELKAAVSGIIAEVGAESPQHLGKVMGVASKKLAGVADGKRISTMAKELLR